MPRIKLMPFKFFIEDTSIQTKKGIIDKRISLGKPIDTEKGSVIASQLLMAYFQKELLSPQTNDALETLITTAHPVNGQVNVNSETAKRENVVIGSLIHGIVHVGKYGISSDIVDKEGGELKYSKSGSDADVVPIYFNMLIPKNRLEGLCILEYYGRQSIKGSIEEGLNKFVKNIKSSLRFKMVNFAPKKEIIHQMKNGDFNKIKIIKYYEKSLKEDRIHSPNSGIKIRQSKGEKGQHIGLKMVQKIYQISESGKNRIKDGLIDLVKNEKKISEVLEFDEDYDAVKIEYSFQGVNKTLDFENKSRYKCSRDISEINKDSRDHPVYSAIHTNGEEMRNEFMSYIAI